MHDNPGCAALTRATALDIEHLMNSAEMGLVVDALAAYRTHRDPREQKGPHHAGLFRYTVARVRPTAAPGIAARSCMTTPGALRLPGLRLLRHATTE